MIKIKCRVIFEAETQKNYIAEVYLYGLHLFVVSNIDLRSMLCEGADIVIHFLVYLTMHVEFKNMKLDLIVLREPLHQRLPFFNYVSIFTNRQMNFIVVHPFRDLIEELAHLLLISMFLTTPRHEFAYIDLDLIKSRKKSL